MQVQQEIAIAFSASRVGKTYDVLIDRAVPDENDAWIGRTMPTLRMSIPWSMLLVGDCDPADW